MNNILHSIVDCLYEASLQYNIAVIEDKEKLNYENLFDNNCSAPSSSVLIAISNIITIITPHYEAGEHQHSAQNIQHSIFIWVEISVFTGKNYGLPLMSMYSICNRDSTFPYQYGENKWDKRAKKHSCLGLDAYLSVYTQRMCSIWKLIPKYMMMPVPIM